MLCWRKNTKKIIAGIFFSILLSQGLFQFAGDALAQYQDPDGTVPTQAMVDAQTNQSTSASGANVAPMGSGMFGSFLDAIKSGIIWLLLQLRNVIFYIVVSPAAGAFVWVVDPTNISGPTGVLNLPAVYTLWQFIRDFFNLFFILILLFSAFATIFQVDSFNIRNIFKNVLLVALLINFSFPITRFLIDAANVPMYYFINDVIGGGTGQGGVIAMNNLLRESGLAGGVLTNIGENDSITLVVTSIIFAFLFGISLAVLAVMLVIRLIALTLLLIFAPIGFAGALLPGLNKYGQEWWSKFWNYALFGPAAALMLTVSLRFLEAVSSGSTWQSMRTVTTNMTPDPQGAVGMAQVILFTFPIILLWTTIGMANKFSIAGAATVTGMGYGAANWTRKKIQRGAIIVGRTAGRTAVGTTKAAANRVPVLRNVPGAYAGVKEAFKDGGKVFGKELPGWATTKGRAQASEQRQAVGKGWVQNGKAGVKDELEGITDKRVKEQMKKYKDENASRSALQEDVKSKDDIKRKAAALTMAANGEIRTVEDLTLALNAVGKNKDNVLAVIEKAKPEAIGKMTKEQHAAIQNAFYEKETDGKLKMKDGKPVVSEGLEDAQGAYYGKLKKEGQLMRRVEYETDLNERERGMTDKTQAKQAAYKEVLGKLSGQDMAKQSDVIQSINTDPAMKQHFEDMAKNQKEYFQKILGSDDLKPADLQVLVNVQGGGSLRPTPSAPRAPKTITPQAAAGAENMTYQGQSNTPNTENRP